MANEMLGGGPFQAAPGSSRALSGEVERITPPESVAPETPHAARNSIIEPERPWVYPTKLAATSAPEWLVLAQGGGSAPGQHSIRGKDAGRVVARCCIECRERSATLVLPPLELQVERLGQRTVASVHTVLASTP
jgi:hypothetical protein